MSALVISYFTFVFPSSFCLCDLVGVGVIDLFINKHYKFYSTPVWKSKQVMKFVFFFPVIDGDLNSEGYCSVITTNDLITKVKLTGTVG